MSVLKNCVGLYQTTISKGRKKRGSMAEIKIGDRLIGDGTPLISLQRLALTITAFRSWLLS